MPNTDPHSGSFTVPDRLHVDALSFDGDSLTVGCRLRGSEAPCPVCGEVSRRVHGRYTRTLADLPRGGLPVRLRVRVRKFFCDEHTCIRDALRPDAEDVRVLGVDDFAFERGDAYGTILVDLERHKVVDLLPERSAEPLEEWLREHPGVEVVARDRSFVYARGITAGAPG